MKHKIFSQKYCKGDVKIVCNFAMPQEKLMTAALYLKGKRAGFTTDVEQVEKWMKDAHA